MLSAPSLRSRICRSCFALALVAATAPGALRAASTDDAGGEVWVTLGEEAFATATDLFGATPEIAALPRLAQAAGVVLTRIPSSSLEALAARLHEVRRKCGGFVFHDSEAEALATLERVRALAASPLRAEGALPFAIDQQELVAPLLAAVSQSAISETIDSLSTDFVNRYHAHATGSAAATWIRDLWLGYADGRPDVTVELYSHGGITPQPSVVLTLAGSLAPDEVVVIGAHEDSIRSGCSTDENCDAPGADDDASGVATISEALRVALAAGFAPQRTVKFMAYAAEEVGLRGSRDLAADFQAAGTNVVAALQIDMTGYNDESPEVDFTIIDDAAWTDVELNQFVRDLVAEYLPGSVTENSICDYACSDHAAWAERGYRAAFPFEAPDDLYNPYLHTGGDDLHRLDMGHAAKFAKLTAAFLVEAAIDDFLFADGFESGGTSAWSPP